MKKSDSTLRELVRFECYKLFQQRFLWVLLLVILIAGLYFSVQRMEWPWADRVNTGFEGNLTSEMIARAEAGSKAYVKKTDPTAEEKKQNASYHNVLEAASANDRQSKVVSSLRQEGEEASTVYEKRHFSLQADLTEAIDYRPVGNYQTFDQLLTFSGTGGYALLAVVLIFGTAVSFSNEYQTGVAAYLYSSRHGRKQLLTAKLLVSVALVTATIVIYNLVQLLCFFRGHSGWDIPIQAAYGNSPYPLTFAELYGISVLYQWVIAVSLVIVLLFLSMLIKQTVVAVFLDGLIVGGPFLIETVLFNTETPAFMWTLVKFTQGQALSVYVLFREYVTVNIFGYPVLLPVAVLVVTLITTLILIKLMYRVIGRRMA